MTQSEFKRHLELQTKLDAAVFGISMIISLCENMKEISERSGKKGDSINNILSYAHTVQDKVSNLPGG